MSAGCGYFIAGAAEIEKNWQQHRDQGLVVIGIDVWNGTPAQVDAVFRQRTEFPDGDSPAVGCGWYV